MVAALTLGFALACILSSATYMINDIADLEADRRHPHKRLRPFASGRLPIAFGMVAAPLMAAGALAGALALSPGFAAAMVAYLAVTASYSYALKRMPLLDVAVIAVLFTLRIVMGDELIGTGHSPWLLSFAVAFFLSLALAKRHAEVMSAVGAAANGGAKGELAGRGYRADDWPLTLTFGIGAGLVSILIMLLYMTNDAAPSGFYREIAWLYAIPALVTLWLMRLWLIAHRGELHHDPVVFALNDRASLALGVVVGVAFWLSL
jgi:4-hydroxybenzoate polyprenyltransferase